MTDEAGEAEWTPTTDIIRSGYLFSPEHWTDVRVGRDFDRWLAAHVAEIHAAGVVEGRRQAREAIRDLVMDGARPVRIGYHGREFTEAVWLSIRDDIVEHLDHVLTT